MKFVNIEQCVDFVESIKNFCYVKNDCNDLGFKEISIDDMNKHGLSVSMFIRCSQSFFVLDVDVSFWFVPDDIAKGVYFWGIKKNTEWDGRQYGFLSAEKLFDLIPNEMCFILSFNLDML